MLRAPPCLLRLLPQATGGPQRGGGSRRSLLPPPWPVCRADRSANPPARARPWEAWLAGCALPLEALALCAHARALLALGPIPLARRGPCPRPTARRSCPPLCDG